MGTPRGGNGDEQPPGGGGPFDGDSFVPPEWGPVVIPDDASALSDESAAIRKEFRREARRYRWRRRFRLTAPRRRESASLAVPLAIMAIAVVATLISLFAVAWPGGYPNGSPNADGVTTNARPLPLPDLKLRDSDGLAVPIRELAPAVIVLVDGCDCERVINNLAATVDPRVSVLVVTTPNPYASASAQPGASAGPGIGAGPGVAGGPSAGPSVSASPTQPGVSASPGVRVWRLLDPAGLLRASIPGLAPLGPIPPKNGTILLVTSDWAVVRVVPTTTPVNDLKGDLANLAG
ncbi:hypothetical protein GCM10009557_01640 [Virgisporangium ochraceum]|uniref:Uncharacterized protein n=1 Tax=Virgisporangium ochraceum TaxID=65505 RepID=A0A8J3ZS74_9ACTN|nr:hypothetical protein [Virgisporangium ochraceum]GIJ66516.1 hypothetical protein Voc01_014330 [Virgisporangium ochraceum]